MNTPIAVKWKRWAAILLCIALILPVIGWVSLIRAGNQWIDDAELQAYYNQVATKTELLEGRPIVHVEDLAPYVTEILIGVEDHRFYLHPGIDPVGVIRSLGVNLMEQSKAQGGSTITMQLARNLFLTQDKTVVRKLKEVAIAAHLEWRYTKEEILNLYLNRVYFGHGLYGMESAAQYYFGKTMRQDSEMPAITQAEAAMLVGLLKAPEHYSPFKFPEKAYERQQVVLNRIHELGWMNDAEWLAAKQDSLEWLEVRGMQRMTHVSNP